MEKHILFTEDDPFLAEILQQALVKAGFKVTLAKDGEEALQCVKDSKPDLILLDLFLPRLDGFGVLAHLHSDPSTVKIPVIILSNLMDPDNVERGKSFGVAAYLIKASTTPEEIISKIREVLGNST